MRLSRDELRKFDRAVAPAPAPVEPALPAAEEAALIAGDKDGDPVVALRRARVLAMLRRAATPEGVDAELIALLAAARALPLDRREDRLSARQRLVGIGKLSNPPPGVSELVRKLGVAPGDGTAFAEALLPSSHGRGEPFGRNDFGANPTQYDL